MVDIEAQRARFAQYVSALSQVMDEAAETVNGTQQKQYTLEILLLRETAKKTTAERRAKVSEDKLAAVWDVVDEWVRWDKLSAVQHEELREAVARAGYDGGIDGVGE